MTFQLKGAPGASESVAFHVFNGEVGINNTNPGAALDVNGSIAIRDGTQANGYILAALDANGLANWQDPGTINVNYATNTGNATTADFANNMTNGTITNSTFIGGIVNRATLANVDLSNSNGVAEWIQTVDGLYPVDGATEDVMIGGTTIAGSIITLEANGTLTAVRFADGDFTGVTNLPYNVEWNDQGTYMFPTDSAGAKTVIVGSNTIATAESIFETNVLSLSTNKEQIMALRSRLVVFISSLG